MDTAMDVLDASFPVIHAVIFVIGVVNNVSLLLASFLRTPKTLTNYSIMIKFGTLNDLIAVFSDFFTMQRLLVIPGNLLYISLGPCSLISPRACFLVYCMQLCTLIYSLLWILNFSTPSTRNMIIVMILLYIPPAVIAFAFTFAQADIEIVQQFLLEHAPSYLTEPGALTGHSGMTFHLIFTILFIVFTPGPVYAIIMILRNRILARLTQHSGDMSDRTKKMHGNLVQALTVHAMLPPITCISVVIYIVLFFNIYHHVALEKAIFTFAAIPPAVGAFCTTYYVEPYRRFVFCQSTRTPTAFTASTVSVTVSSAPSALMRGRARTVMDTVERVFPTLHSIIFLIGVSTNIGLLLASFYRTPRALKTYSIMIKFGSLNDLIAIFCDFFTMQRMPVLRDNLIYLSMGPCSRISARACYLGYCMQLCTLIYSFYVMTACFAYRLWILNRPSPNSRNVLLIMLALYIPPILVTGSFTFAQADDVVVREYLLKSAYPSYLMEPGALTGHSGMTPHLVFTILFVIFTPGPAYALIMLFRYKIISKLRLHATEMSERTRKMHSTLVHALTIHAMLPPITLFAVAMYPLMFFDIYRHAVLEKAMYTIAAIPTAFSSLCTIYYVEPY